MSHLIRTLLITCIAVTPFTSACSLIRTESAPVSTDASPVAQINDALPTLTEGDAPGNDVYVLCGEDPHAAVATINTSCPFAASVHGAYPSNVPQSAVVTAYSPVTKLWYTMQCQGGFPARTKSGQTISAIRCVGGNNAVVVIV